MSPFLFDNYLSILFWHLSRIYHVFPFPCCDLVQTLTLSCLGHCCHRPPLPCTGDPALRSQYPDFLPSRSLPRSFRSSAATRLPVKPAPSTCPALSNACLRAWGHTPTPPLHPVQNDLCKHSRAASDVFRWLPHPGPLRSVRWRSGIRGSVGSNTQCLLVSGRRDGPCVLSPAAQ